jgi:hypothetical protein
MDGLVDAATNEHHVGMNPLDKLAVADAGRLLIGVRARVDYGVYPRMGGLPFGHETIKCTIADELP